jgi:hypothetical protein
VIGKTAYYVEERDALDYVAGYTIMNDVSARCLQAQGLLTIAKGFETFCPIGPWMVTKDEIPDPQNLTVRTYINDLEVCKAHTSEMCSPSAVHRGAVARLSARARRCARHRITARTGHVSRPANPGEGRRRDAHRGREDRHARQSGGCGDALICPLSAG